MKIKNFLIIVLIIFVTTSVIAEAEPLCCANQALTILCAPNPSMSEVYKLLAQCDKQTPNDVQTLLLHGLVARKEALVNKNYTVAIYWLEKAKAVAPPGDNCPALELALTYEWALQFCKAQQIYDAILIKDPASHPALLGSARIALAQYKIRQSKCIYQKLLLQNAQDRDALNGLAQVQQANKEFCAAQVNYHKVLNINPTDQDAQAGLARLKDDTKYRLDIFGGQYSVKGQNSYSSNVNLYAGINATDQILLLLNNNTQQLQLGFINDPTILPNNSVLLGFQRQIPNAYGWGVSYDYRQRDGFTTESRIAVNGNVYLTPQLQWFGGARDGFPSPWNNKLGYSGFTLFTHLPWNYTVTGFWGQQQIGGFSSGYSFDLSKEFVSGTFYNAGAAYSPTQTSWDIHGRIGYAVTKHQSVLVSYEHYFYNTTTYFTMGWRVCW